MTLSRNSLQTRILRLLNKLKVVYDALLDSITHYSIMAKWSIFDARFTILFTYLTHSYKLKFITVNSDKIMSEFLDDYKNEKFYQDGKSIFIEGFFDFLKEQFKVLNKLRKNTIFEAVLFETMRKLYVIFFKHLTEMIKHPNFDLPIKYVNYLLTEAKSLKKYLKNITVLIHNSYGFDHYVVDSCSRRVYIIELGKEIKASLITILVKYVRPCIEEMFKSTSLSEINFDKLTSVIEQKEADFGEIHQAYKNRYIIQRTTVIIEQFLKKVLDSNKNKLVSEIKTFYDNFVVYAGKFEEEILSDHIIYIDQLHIFFTASIYFKSEMSLASIYNLLSIKLKKKELTDLINLKIYDSKNDFKKKLHNSISHYFEKNQLLQKDLQFHRKSTRILRIFMNTLLFLIKVKRKKKISHVVESKKKKKKTMKPDLNNEFINERIDFDLVYTKKAIKVSYQIVNKPFLKKHYKSLPVTEV